MQIIGHCRFSWLGISDTGRELVNRADAAAVLWSPQRMAVRFHLFETLLLPCLRAQTDQDFRFLLTTSAAMPQMYFDRLAKLTQDQPNVEILVTDKDDIGHALSPVMQASIEAGPKPVHFRLDDDDGVCATYVERLRTLCTALDFSAGTAISFPSGVISVYDGEKFLNAPTFRPYIAIGLAFIAGPDYRRDPFRIQHRRVGERNTSYLDPSFCAFHYTRHSANNTNGYGEDHHNLAADKATAARLQRNHPDLAQGGVTTAGLDDAINTAFPFTTAEKLRADLASHAQYNALAEEMGFLGRG